MSTATTTSVLISSRGRIIFDGDCPLCQRSIAIVRKLDWLGRFEYVNARDASQELLRVPPVAGAPLLEEMHLLTPDGKHLYHGFGAFRWMAWRLPLCWLIAPLLYVPGVPWLGQRVYLWIARNRFQLVPCRHGVCDIQQKQ
jgi:predicted DCC family thiol-disulfide oxidoreductase YuxK